MIRTFQTRLLGDLASLRARASEQLGLAPALQATSKWSLTRSSVRLNGLLHLGTAELWSGDVDAAADHLQQGLVEAESPTAAAGDAYLQLNCLSQLALAEVARGRLRDAAERGRSAVAFAERRGWSQAMQAFGGHLALAWAHYHQGDLDAAAHHLEQASQAAHEPIAVVSVALVRSWLLTSQGRPGDGLATLRAVITRASGGHRWQPLRMPADLQLSEVRLLVASGHTQEARALLAQRGGGEPPAAEAAVVSALLHLAEGDPAGAATALAPCLHGPASPAHPLLMLEAWLLDAVVRAELSDHDQAARSLERALAVAERDGYRQPFIDQGAPMQALLARQSRTDHPALVAELLARAAERSHTAPPSPATLVEPLSSRELTVLHLLPSPLSTAEIASQLYVSANTVKTHLRSIYRKLDSNDRRGAVNRARQLGLL
jgi:LuxR family maltose regulon positive regulatory protein